MKNLQVSPSGVSWLGLFLCGILNLTVMLGDDATPAVPPERKPTAREIALYHLGLNDQPPVQPISEDETGFVSIFDGKTLTGWDGDPKYWRVENGELVGEVTPETLLSRNTFVIWRGGTPHNFELKGEYRISAHGNSGINYRSIELPGLRWAMEGYQFDIEGFQRWTGQNYEERGRSFLALRGQMTRIEEGQPPIILGQLGDPKELQSFVKAEDWNQVDLIVRDNIVIHILNGHVMSAVIDDDSKNRHLEGLIGVQVHVGPPMKVEYKNLRLKNL